MTCPSWKLEFLLRKYRAQNGEEGRRRKLFSFDRIFARICRLTFLVLRLPLGIREPRQQIVTLSRPISLAESFPSQNGDTYQLFLSVDRAIHLEITTAKHSRAKCVSRIGKVSAPRNSSLAIAILSLLDGIRDGFSGGLGVECFLRLFDNFCPLRVIFFEWTSRRCGRAKKALFVSSSSPFPTPETGEEARVI